MISCKDPQEIANKFNRYFVDSIEEIASQIPAIGDVENVVDNIEMKGLFSQFRKVELKDIKDIVKNLNASSELGDGIDVRVLKDATEVAANRLLDVVNESLVQGEMPDWKVTDITPTPKVAGTMNAHEFRPINKVPCYEKVIEQVGQ